MHRRSRPALSVPIISVNPEGFVVLEGNALETACSPHVSHAQGGLRAEKLSTSGAMLFERCESTSGAKGVPGGGCEALEKAEAEAVPERRWRLCQPHPPAGLCRAPPMPQLQCEPQGRLPLRLRRRCGRRPRGGGGCIGATGLRNACQRKRRIPHPRCVKGRCSSGGGVGPPGGAGADSWTV